MRSGKDTATQQSIVNLTELKLYGLSGKEIQITDKADDENNPICVWTVPPGRAS